MSISLLQMFVSSTIMERSYFPVRAMVDGFRRTKVTRPISKEIEGVIPQDEDPGLFHMMVYNLMRSSYIKEEQISNPKQIEHDDYGYIDGVVVLIQPKKLKGP